MIEKLKKILSVGISVVFYLYCGFYFLNLLWMVLDLSSFQDTELAELMSFRLKMSVFLVIMCLFSVILNKKVLMVIWMAGLIYIQSFYNGFPEYNRYVEFETCLDMGRVWDFDEHRCRNDCLKWTKEEGCLPIKYVKQDKETTQIK